MDFFDEEIINFLRSLQKNKVQYLLVGGFATNLNGYQRFTGDINLWLYDSVENRKALRKAFADYGLGDLRVLKD